MTRGSFRLFCRTARIVLALALLTPSAGCSGKSDRRASDKDETRAGDLPTGGAPSTRAGKARAEERKEKRAEVEGAVRAALESWLKAQNDGDRAGYHALYHERHFKGVRRTHNGKVKRFDALGWRDDRDKMFKLGKLSVAADDVTVTTWLDPGVELKSGVIITRFIQRWRGGKYADHGVKVLHWWRDREGALRIIYEDLLNSERGWDRNPDAEVAAAAMTVPASQEAAMAAWRKLAPTGADYQNKLATIPAGEVAQAMAHALILDNDFHCTEVVEYAECGEEFSEFAPLPDDAGFDNTCLRRRLALWSLERLSSESIAALVEPLTGAVTRPEPTSELAEKILKTGKKAGEPVRMALLLKADADLVADHLQGLSDAGLVRLYRERRIARAVELLSATTHEALLIEALLDDALPHETRAAVLSELSDIKKPAMTEALRELAEDDDCALAMGAAELLAARGDPSHLPRKPHNDDPVSHAQALCMLIHDGESARANERWQAFFPPDDTIDDVHETYNEFAEAEAQMARAEAEENGEELPPEDEEDDPGKSETSQQLVRATSTIADLDSSFGEAAMSCEGMSCSVNTDMGTYTVTFEVAADGELYLSELRLYSEIGCGC